MAANSLHVLDHLLQHGGDAIGRFLVLLPGELLLDPVHDVGRGRVGIAGESLDLEDVLARPHSQRVPQHVDRRQGGQRGVSPTVDRVDDGRQRRGGTVHAVECSRHSPCAVRCACLRFGGRHTACACYTFEIARLRCPVRTEGISPPLRRERGTPPDFRPLQQCDPDRLVPGTLDLAAGKLAAAVGLQEQGVGAEFARLPHAYGHGVAAVEKVQEQALARQSVPQPVERPRPEDHVVGEEVRHNQVLRLIPDDEPIGPIARPDFRDRLAGGQAESHRGGPARVGSERDLRHDCRRVVLENLDAGEPLGRPGLRRQGQQHRAELGPVRRLRVDLRPGATAAEDDRQLVVREHDVAGEGVRQIVLCQDSPPGLGRDCPGIDRLGRRRAGIEEPRERRARLIVGAAGRADRDDKRDAHRCQPRHDAISFVGTTSSRDSCRNPRRSA